MKIYLSLLLLLPLFANALEVDEKLTARIIKTSETRKTVLINRGTEDGLVEGDHAKFIVTAGIVARGVCVKLSPTRSVWSIYRLVNADFIVNDSVMTLKITPPVKITKDPTQALVQEDVPSRVSTDPTTLGIPLAEGARDLTPSEDAGEEDLMALTEGERTVSTLVEETMEVFAILNISGLTSTSKTEEGDTSFNNSQAYHHIGIGGELYPQNERQWYSRFSLVGSLNIMRLNSQAFNGATASNDVTEFSVGTNWHFSKLPSAVFQFIPFVHLSVHMGTLKSTFKPGSDNPGGPEFESNGNSTGFAAGFGYKYFTSHGFGARAVVDYYMRTEKYEEGDAGDAFNKVVSGPRLMVGLSYRF